MFHMEYYKSRTLFTCHMGLQVQRDWSFWKSHPSSHLSVCENLSKKSSVTILSNKILTHTLSQTAAITHRAVEIMGRN